MYYEFFIYFDEKNKQLENAKNHIYFIQIIRLHTSQIIQSNQANEAFYIIKFIFNF